MKYVFILILGFFPIINYAQFSPGPHITSLGNTGVVIQDVWSLQSNPAGLAKLKRPILAGAFERKFLSPELSTKSAVFAFPVKENVFGLSFENYGFSAYSDQKVGFAYARRFGRTIFAALNFNFHQIKITQYGSAESFSVEAGLQYQASEKLLIGAHIANPNRSGYNNEVNAVIPVLAEFGLSYKFTDKVNINSAISKTLSSTADARLGIAYNICNWFALRGGLSSFPLRQYAGFGLEFEGVHFDVAGSSHPTLGYSPQVALAYEF